MTGGAIERRRRRLPAAGTCSTTCPSSTRSPASGSARGGGPTSECVAMRTAEGERAGADPPRGQLPDDRTRRGDAGRVRPAGPPLRRGRALSRARPARSCSGRSTSQSGHAAPRVLVSSEAVAVPSPPWRVPDRRGAGPRRRREAWLRWHHAEHVPDLLAVDGVAGVYAFGSSRRLGVGPDQGERFGMPAWDPGDGSSPSSTSTTTWPPRRRAWNRSCDRGGRRVPSPASWRARSARWCTTSPGPRPDRRV